MVILMVMIIMMILMFDDLQSLFCSVVFPCFVAADDDADDSNDSFFSPYMLFVFFRLHPLSSPVQPPRCFYGKSDIAGNLPRPRSKPWDVRVIVASWNHPKPLRSLVSEPVEFGSRGRNQWVKVGSGWAEVG